MTGIEPTLIAIPNGGVARCDVQRRGFLDLETAALASVPPGDEDFVARRLKAGTVSESVAVPRAQRRPPPPSLDAIQRAHAHRNAAIAAAYATGAYSYQQIGDHFGLHFSSVAKVVRKAKHTVAE